MMDKQSPYTDAVRSRKVRGVSGEELAAVGFMSSIASFLLVSWDWEEAKPL